jgi:hypothetical protein
VFTLIHGLGYGAVTTGYLLVMMLTVSPRVWGYADYPDAVKKKVPPPTRREKTLGAVIGVPWFALLLGLPILSTLMLREDLGGHISFPRAFGHVMVLILFATLGDLVLLDWFVVSRVTPRFVIIPGSDKGDYKDMSHHFKGHAKAAVPLAILGALIAWLACRI